MIPWFWSLLDNFSAEFFCCLKKKKITKNNFFFFRMTMKFILKLFSFFFLLVLSILLLFCRGGGRRKESDYLLSLFSFSWYLIFENIYPHLLGIPLCYSHSTVSSIGFLWYRGITFGLPELYLLNLYLLTSGPLENV